MDRGREVQGSRGSEQWSWEVLPRWTGRFIRILALFTFIGQIVLGGGRDAGEAKAQEVAAPVRLTLVGEGKFETSLESSSTFVKNQLKRAAFQEVITKALQQMRLDPRPFWQEYERKFEQFAPSSSTPTELEADKGVLSDPEMNKLQGKVEFMESSGLVKVISSYTIKDISRSPVNPRMKYMTLEAAVDKELLHRIYQRYVGTPTPKKLKRLFLSSQLHISGNDWTQVGVQDHAQLGEALEDSWKKWLEQKLGSVLDGDVVLERDYERSLVQEASASATGKESPIEKENSLWLKVNVDIKKLHEDLMLRRRELELSVDFVLIDLETGLPLSFEEIKAPPYAYSFQDEHVLSSQVGSAIYRLPLSGMGSLLGPIKGLGHQLLSGELVIKGGVSFAHLIRLQDLIDMQGPGLQAKSQIVSLSAEEGRLKIWYDGDESKMREVLLGLDKAPLEASATVYFPNRDDPWTIQLMPVELSPEEQDKGEGRPLPEALEKESDSKIPLEAIPEMGGHN